MNILGMQFTILSLELSLIKETNKNGLSLSFLETLLQKQSQRRCSSIWSRRLSATSSISSRFYTIRKYFLVSRPILSSCIIFILCLWMQAFLRQKSTVWAVISRKIYFLISIIINIFKFYHQWFYLWSSINSKWFK